MRDRALLIGASIMGSVLASSPCAWGGVVDPHFRTDRSVDTRSTRTILRDLIRPGMTSEEKALALFHWVRRVIYHSGPEEPLRHDFNRMVNLFGYGSCYLQTHPLSHLFQQLGWPCRNWVHNGHHMLEVYYDGGWHCFDPHMTFYVFNRAAPRAIASVAELRADPTLAEAAVKEGRTGPAFLICGDAPTWFSGDTGWVLDHPFLPHRGADEEFGSLHLRRGERFVRTWKAGRYFRPHAFLEKHGPYHTCGPESDRRDPVNFPYWEPYAWRDREAASHRHHGTGYLEYRPDLRRDSWRDAALRFINLASDLDETRPALHPVEGGMEAEVIFSVKCPYILTGASLEVAGHLGAAGDRLVVGMSNAWNGDSQGREWKEVLAASSPGEVRRRIDLSPHVEGSLDGYWLRIVMLARNPQQTGLDSLKLRTEFQLNPYALPQLLPGANRLFVTAARCDRPWHFRLAWQEGPDWKTPREHRATLDGTSYEGMVDVSGPKFPRMEEIEFSVDP
jgi:hypothetical protein